MSNKLSEEVIEQNKQEFLNICRTVITRPGINELLDWLEHRSDFFIAPASANYHSAYPGGLVEHSLNVYKMCKEFKDTINPKYSVYERHCDNITEENIAIACLFHDLCKTNYYTPTEKWRKDENNQWVSIPTYKVIDKFPCGHGEKSVILLQQFMRLTGEEILAIRWHMGAFSAGTILDIYQKNAFLSALEYPLTNMLCIADQYASFMMEERDNDKM
jgi:HD superfamily phosphohydrolase YqeK